MKLEPLIDLVERSESGHVHYARACLTHDDRKKLVEIFSEDRLAILDGAQMQIWEDCARLIFSKLNLEVRKQYGDLYFVWTLKDAVDGLGTDDDVPRNIVLIVENAEKVLNKVKKSDLNNYFFDDLCTFLSRAGKHASEPQDEFDITRGPVGFHAVFLFDPENRKPKVGNASYLKL